MAYLPPSLFNTNVNNYDDNEIENEAVAELPQVEELEQEPEPSFEERYAAAFQRAVDNNPWDGHNNIELWGQFIDGMVADMVDTLPKREAPITVAELDQQRREDRNKRIRLVQNGEDSDDDLVLNEEEAVRHNVYRRLDF